MSSFHVCVPPSVLSLCVVCSVPSTVQDSATVIFAVKSSKVPALQLHGDGVSGMDTVTGMQAQEGSQVKATCSVMSCDRRKNQRL